MSRFVAVAHALFVAREKTAFRICLALLCGWMVLLAGLTLKTGTVCQADMPWDTMSLLDGAYRLHSGQIPNVDYFSPIGVLPVWLVELGMKWGGVNVNAFVWGTVFAFLALTPLAWFVAARRFPPVAALLWAVFIGGLVIARRPLPFGTLPYDFEFSHLSYAMWYNRIGWALLTLFALYWFVPPFPAKGKRWTGDAEALAMGAVFAALAISKVNYIAGALGVMLIGGIFARPPLRQALAYAAGTVAAFLAVTLLTGWTLRAWWGDLVELARVADASGRLDKVFVTLSNNTPAFLLLLAAVAALWPLLKPGIARPLVLAGACAGIGFAVLILNTQYTEIPLLAVGCALLLESAIRRKDEAGPGSISPTTGLRLTVAACAGLALMGGTMFSDNASVAYAWAARNRLYYLTPQDGTIGAPPLRALILPPQRHEQVERGWVVNDLYARRVLSPRAAERTPMTPYQFAFMINNGLELLKGRVTPTSRVFCLNHNNPFPLALQLPPPGGGCLWWDPVTFTPRRHPGPAAVFADVTHVLVRRVHAGSYALEEVYLPYIKSHFHKTAESTFWELYEKEPSHQSGTGT